MHDSACKRRTEPAPSDTSGADPEPVAWVNRDSRSPLFLVCEHAGQFVPSRLGGLGLPSDAMDRHIGWDIGAGRLARSLAARLNAPLACQRYSRLVVDCNRPPTRPSAFPKASDGQVIPGNSCLDTAERAARIRQIFDPFDAALNEGVTRFRRKAAISIHSFNYALSDGQVRPWHAGFLSRRDTESASALMHHVKAHAPHLSLALNEPYRIEDDTDWFIPRYAEAYELRHCLIEIRNDQLQDDAGVARWASLLAPAIQSFLVDC